MWRVVRPLTSRDVTVNHIRCLCTSKGRKYELVAKLPQTLSNYSLLVAFSPIYPPRNVSEIKGKTGPLPMAREQATNHDVTDLSHYRNETTTSKTFSHLPARSLTSADYCPSPLTHNITVPNGTLRGRYYIVSSVFRSSRT